MKKRIKRLSGLFLAAVMVTLSAVIPVHAAGWQENDTGRWYEKQDGSWPENEWKLIGHKWYYFNGAGLRGNRLAAAGRRLVLFRRR